ncbi:MAG: hypothetical protein IPN29_12500 [Saprospiraceae bacterium]|nr:hypothetical protein [Saprospiraceae bacterium]
MNIKTIAPIMVCLFCGVLSAQKHLNNTVILYNVVPLRVDLNKDGTIRNVYGEDVNYLRGYTLVKPASDDKNNTYGNSEAYNVVSTEVYDIRFGEKSAVLSHEAIQALDKSADVTFFDGHRILVSPYLSAEDRVSKTLLKNRMNACLTYLEIKGIKKEQIIINTVAIQNIEQAIKIAFIE